ncbi:DUF7576 family protein [Halorussus lipolyticus]|uniref:DUF7576 family protein n=1 Tax=Halorussus lipolyticus TaxID=3034024 RepID=UPI0023E7C87B|nr:hypothetical protein [Halorussus sp. DT80]
MPELYGEFEGEADAQFVACVVCGTTLDLFESHPMFRDEDVSEVGEVVARTYHFCSDDCLQQWRRGRDSGE